MPDTANGWPYPTSTMTPDVPRDIKALADALDVKAPRRVVSGSVVVPFSPASVAASVVVTFPVGAFTAAPVVVATVTGSSNYVPFTSSVGASSAAIGARQADNASAAVSQTVHYVAIQD